MSGWATDSTIEPVRVEWSGVIRSINDKRKQ